MIVSTNNCIIERSEPDLEIKFIEDVLLRKKSTSETKCWVKKYSPFP